MFLAIAVILFCTPFIWWFLFLQKYKSLSVIPGPRPIPLLGNANDLGQTPQGEYPGFIYGLDIRKNVVFKLASSYKKSHLFVIYLHLNV